jgi:2-methylcitrate dehydratase PrpD
LRRQRPFGADDVSGINVIGPPLIKRLCGRPDIASPNANYARLCMPFIGAKVLLHGEIDLAHFRGDELTDSATHALAKCIAVTADGNPDPNAFVPQEVVVTLKDGTMLRWHCVAMLASPTRRLTREQHLAKFRRCLDFAKEPLRSGTGGRLIELVDRLEELTDIRELTKPLLTGMG